MTKTVTFAWGVILATALAPVSARQTAPAPAVSYETYCQKDRIGKQELRKTMTVEQKAEMARTQIERWRDANESRLTAEQRSLITDWIKVIPESALPRAQRGPESEARLTALAAKIEAAFSREELRAMDEYGPCIAKRKLSA